jgi:hypothetical protein
VIFTRMFQGYRSCAWLVKMLYSSCVIGSNALFLVCDWFQFQYLIRFKWSILREWLVQMLDGFKLQRLYSIVYTCINLDMYMRMLWLRSCYKLQTSHLKRQCRKTKRLKTQILFPNNLVLTMQWWENNRARL